MCLDNVAAASVVSAVAGDALANVFKTGTPAPNEPYVVPGGRVAKAEITVGGSPTSSQRVTLYGTSRTGEEISEEVEASGTAVKTDNWFTSFTGLASTGSTALGASNTVTLGVPTDGYQQITLTAGDRLLNGLTIVQVIGGSEGVVDTFYDCFLQSVNFSFSREGVIEETWTVVGREGTLNLSPVGTEADVFVPTTLPAANPLGSGTVQDFVDSTQEAISGWQCGMNFTATTATTPKFGFALIDATLTANANVNFTPRVGQRPAGVPYKRTSEITLNFTTEYHKEYEPLVQAQLDAAKLDNVEIELIFSQRGQFPIRKLITFKQLEFTDPLTRVIDSDDFVRLTGTARALPSTSSALDDITYTAEVAETTDWAGVESAEQDTTEGKLRYYA